MHSVDVDREFVGSIPEFYQRYLVPPISEPYAVDIAPRVVELKPACVLELAAGTGVVTRHLSRALPARSSIVATDLNPPMLDQAALLGLARAVGRRRAHPRQLPVGADACCPRRRPLCAL